MQNRTHLTEGIFDPAMMAALATAFGKATDCLDRWGPEGPDRDLVARQIVAQARTGETEPELLWRAGLARALVAVRR